MKICKIYEIEGAVQGVGFRPFVFALAQKYALKGVVFNQAQGVYIEAEGAEEKFGDFERELKNSIPPLACVDSISITNAKVKNFTDFRIEKSLLSSAKSTIVLPDMSICEDCEKEFKDPTNRRFGYPLINCTNCGPRYSIIKTVPYDRANTSMSIFEMCEECAKEYNEPRNRRYHAQPISCPKCGPKIAFYENSNSSFTDNPIERLAALCERGAIGALKGTGGFHIVCDALNENSVQALREKKRRPKKPFAVLFPNIEMIKKYCIVTREEERALLSRERPIVLVRKRADISVAESVAPVTNRLGVFLPYTALHIKLLELLNRPLIATSANISGEPIISDKEALLEKLGGVIEGFVEYERQILNFSDDSVVQFADNRPLYLRTSRSLSPRSFKASYRCDKKILALGAHQKSTISIFNGANIITSPYIGDLDSVESIEAYEKTIDTFRRFYDFAPDILVCDKHPNYASSVYARKSTLEVLRVQHHYAHILAVMIEHGLDESVLGAAWDGTGLGDDGTIWGGEFFVCDRQNYKRVNTFAPFKLLGGDSSIKNIAKIAFSILYPHRDKAGGFFDKFADFKALSQLYEKNINAPLCSSVGRLFDAAAVICGLENVSFEGESGLFLESLYDERINESYDISIDENGAIVHSFWFLQMLKEPRAVAATKFINTLSNALVLIAQKHNKAVVLGGGVFQNRTLVERVSKQMRELKIPLFTPSTISPNDSSISLGQIVYALERLKK